MQPGQRQRSESGPSRTRTLCARLPVVVPFLILCVHGTGCFGPTKRASVEKHLLSNKSPEQRHQEVIETYRAACPDVVHIEVMDQPHFNGNYTIAADGRIRFGNNAVRIE